MITRFYFVGRAVFAEYSDGTSKLVAVADFDEYGFTYDQAIENAELIASALNKTVLSQAEPF